MSILVYSGLCMLYIFLTRCVLHSFVWDLAQDTLFLVQVHRHIIPMYLRSHVPCVSLQCS